MIKNQQNIKTEKSVKTEEQVQTMLPFSVVLYNDDYHSFEDVIYQIIKAIKCSFEEAKSKTFEVHTHGKARVFTGEIQKCLTVSSVLQEIGLSTQIITEN